MNQLDRRPADEIPVQSVDLKQAIEQAASILQDAGAEEVYVFGSAVEGSLRPDSDVDLAVVGLPPAIYFQTMGKLLSILPRPLDLIDLDIDTPFTRYLKRKGKLYRVA